MEDLLRTAHSLSSHSQRESSLLNLVMQFRKVAYCLYTLRLHYCSTFILYSLRIAHTNDLVIQFKI